MTRESEFKEHIYIKNMLKKLGWNVKNPDRDFNGQLYTQEEHLLNPELKAELGSLKPDFVIKISEIYYWVIEIKSKTNELHSAISQAKKYGNLINRGEKIKAKIITGIAGNDSDGYEIENYYLESDNFYKVIKHNSIEITSLLSPQQVEMLINKDSSDLMDLSIDEKHMLDIAENINEILHSASINKDDRAAVIACLLLAQIDSKLDLTQPPQVFVRNINDRAEDVLIKHNKKEFYEHIELKIPNSKQAQMKFKKALTQTISLLNEINIKAAMNSGADILGEFYEVFLKYGNGAKDIGIVLTPRHITKFACDVLDIDQDDIVYDPTCGTGGFLVSAYDYVRKKCSKHELNDFKKHKIFGVELQPRIASLAIVNMIFRGDGKNNIINEDCLSQHLTRKTINESLSAEYLSNISKNEKIRPVTKTLMNPPFALKEKDEKEYKFVEHALDQMQDGGLLFSVLPYSTLVKQGRDLEFRKRLLKNNTLLCVISFPSDLFYPINVLTVGIMIKKGEAHPLDQNVLWVSALKDGYLKVKGRRLFFESEQNDIKDVTYLIKKFIHNPQTTYVEDIGRYQMAHIIDSTDTCLELVPEVYLSEKKDLPFIEIINGIDDVIRKFISFALINNLLPLKKLKDIDEFKIQQRPSMHTNLKEVLLIDILGKPDKGLHHVHGNLPEGNIPLVSTSTQNNGIVGFYDVPDKMTFSNSITVASDGTPLTTFYQPQKFAAKDNVIIFHPPASMEITTIFYIIMEINRVRWRFSYGRKCYLNKIDKVEIMLPHTTDGKIDENYISNLMKSFLGWQIVEKIIYK